VTVSFTASDALSGGVSAPADVVLGEGANQSVTRSVTDRAGNSTTASVGPINVDKTAPVTTVATVNGPLNPDGTYSGPVTVTLSAADQSGLSGVRRTYFRIDGSAVQTYDPQAGIVVAGGGTHTVAFWSEDVAGNIETPGSRTVQIVGSMTVAITGAPTTGPEGTAIALGSTVTPGGAPVTYLWAVQRNGSAYPTGTPTNGPTFTFTPDDNATYTVTLTVTGTGAGDSASTAAMIVVFNVAPTPAIADQVYYATTGVAVTGVEGVGVALVGSGQDPSPVDQAAGFTYHWSATRNGNAVSLAGSDTSAGRLVFAPTEPGTYTVNLTVTDKDGGASSISRTVTIVRADGTVLLDDPYIEPVGPGQPAPPKILFVGGSDGNDKIQFLPGSGGAQVKVKLNGVETAFLGIGRVVVFAHTGADDVQFAGGVTLRTYVDGGVGNDRLKGGGGTNVLVGGAGDDLLIGGDARDVLIGGFGSDRLIGNDQDDILIAGYTDFDTNAVALNAVLREWARTDADFATRVSHLNGTSPAGSLNQGVYLTSQTVHDDGAIDILTGDTGLDWYIFNVDGTAHDQATDMSTYEASHSDDISFMNEL
jgi:PKD repeat protein